MISVVIPSIYEKSLFKTLNSINKSSLTPKEVIIVLPTQLKDIIDIKKLSKYKNIKIEFSKKKGQVQQRIHGFKIASQPYVLQLDSDIVVKKKTIELLYKFIKSKKNVSVSGYIFNTNKTTIKKDFLNKYFNYLLFHGEIQPKPGTVSQLGIPFSFGNNDFKEEITEVDWVQGGIVLHQKRNLIFKNYFKFSGPAYCEDVFHSLLLRKKKIRLYLHKNAVCIHNDNPIYKLRYKFLNEYKIRLKLFKILNNKMYIRFNLWFLFYMVKTNLNFFIKKQ